MATKVAASIGKTDPVQTGWKAMKLCSIAYVVPFLFVFSPSFGIALALAVLLVIAESIAHGRGKLIAAPDGVNVPARQTVCAQHSQRMGRRGYGARTRKPVWKSNEESGKRRDILCADNRHYLTIAP